MARTLRLNQRPLGVVPTGRKRVVGGSKLLRDLDVFHGHSEVVHILVALCARGNVLQGGIRVERAGIGVGVAVELAAVGVKWLGIDEGLERVDAGVVAWIVTTFRPSRFRVFEVLVGLDVLLQVVIPNKLGLAARNRTHQVPLRRVQGPRDLVDRRRGPPTAPIIHRPGHLEMDVPNVVLEVRLAREALPAAPRHVPLRQVLRLPDVHLPAHEPLPLVRGPYVDVQIRPLGEPLPAPHPLALQPPRLRRRLAPRRMLHLHVPSEVMLRATGKLAEDAVRVLLAHVVLQLRRDREADRRPVLPAHLAPELELAVLAILVVPEGPRRVVGRGAVGFGAEEGREVQVVLADVSLEGGFLAEGLRAGAVGCALEAGLVLGVDRRLVAPEAGRGAEGRVAAGLVAGVFPFAGVDVGDVLLEVLLLDVRLGAPFVGALVGALPGVRPLVDGEARGPTEGLVAAGEGAEEVLRLRGGPREVG